MPKYNASEIQDILANENWLGLDQKALEDLEHSIEKYVDVGYESVGANYVSIFDELSDVSKQQIVSYVKKVEKAFPEKHKLQILDIGAGHGLRALELAKQKKVNLKAVEPSEYFYARHLLELEKEGALPFGCSMKSSMSNLPFENAVFDGLYCNAVLHHQFYLAGKNIGIEKAFSEFSRVLLKGGKLFILTIHGDAVHLRDKRFFQSLNEKIMETLAKRNSFVIEEMKQITGMGPFGKETKWLEVYLSKR